MKNWKPWLAMVLVFLAGFAGGIVVARAAVRHFVRVAIQDPNFIRGRIEKRAAARLHLDAQQRAKLHSILLEAQTDLKSLRAEFQPRFLAIMKHAETEMDAALTPEQHEKFERYLQENRHWWQPR